MDKAIHGGDLNSISNEYGLNIKDIWDFSGNINPLGFSKNVKKQLCENIDIITMYPDREYTDLKNSISKYTNADVKNIVVGNGSTELISTFINISNSKKTIIVAPAYSEYEREAKICGSEIKYFKLEEQNNFELDLNSFINEISNDVGMVIICNPNNPTGTVITNENMEVIVSHCKKNNTFLMVDETYIEFSDNIDNICSIPLVKKFDNIFVIRGISKFFSAPGIRLGYGICSNKIFLDTINYKSDPWNVNIFASFVGEKLFSDFEFIENTIKLISNERKKAFLKLSEFKNIKYYNSYSNFILLKLLDKNITSSEIFEKLIKHNILIRDAKSFKFLDSSYLRFCILKDYQNEILLNELKKIVG